MVKIRGMHLTLLGVVVCKKVRKMTPLQQIKELVRYSIATTFVKPYNKGEKFSPVNLMLIAPAECGKTRQLSGILCRKTYETLDISPKIVTQTLVPKIYNREISFLIIPDLIQMLGHKKTTKDSIIGFLNALIEEGVKDSDFFGLEFHLDRKIHAGLLTAVTTEKFFSNVKNWNDIGFLHRILPITYDYSEMKVNEINSDIASGKLFQEINQIAIDRKQPIKIKIPNKYSQDIMLIMERVRARFKEFKIKTYNLENRNKKSIYLDIKGFRLHDRLRQLARAIAFHDSKGKRKEVNANDIIKLRQISEVLNFPNTTIQL